MKEVNKQSSGIIELPNARFTVISPICIRMEYSESGEFINKPSWFAINRDVFCEKYTLEENGKNITIKTEALTLNYTQDGKPFSTANLKIKFDTGSSLIHWVFGMKNQFNLGGTLQTLDGIQKALELPEGLLSRDGWFYLDDSKTHLFNKDWIETRPENSGSDGYFFGYGNDYKMALQNLVVISGKVPLPRKYILGSWYSRWYSYTSEDYMNIVNEFDEHDIPLDILVMDMDWHRKEDAKAGHGWASTLGWTGWSWNKELIKDPEALLQWCHDRGLHVTLNVHPHDGIRTHEDCYDAFMEEMGAAEEKGTDIPFQAGDKKYMDAYFNCAHKPLEDQGVDFWWVDWQQDSVIPFAVGLEGMPHLPLLNHCYYKHTGSTGNRGLSFSRWAGWGDQRYPINFSGDANSNWDMLAFEIYFTATAGNVGCFYWSHDIGGFYGERNPELYARWVQFGITTAALRLHSTGDDLDRRPWKWGSVMEDSMRKSFKLRSKLIPYIYSSMRQGYDKAMPLNRPMYFEYPEIDQAYNVPHQYLLGDGILTAPVISPGQGENYEAVTNVWLPEGTWVNWFTKEYIEGPCTIEIKSDINSFPIFVRGSYPLVMQPETNRMTSTPLKKVEIKCFHSNCDQTAVLYEDDGISDKYQDGEYATTEIIYHGKNDSAELEIKACEGTYENQLPARSYEIELDCPEVSRIELNSKPYTTEQIDGKLLIQIEEQDIRKAQHLKLYLC
jgi:alpha-glucosidase (family GH31 glycosyl hydrolase)